MSPIEHRPHQDNASQLGRKRRETCVATVKSLFVSLFTCFGLKVALESSAGRQAPPPPFIHLCPENSWLSLLRILTFVALRQTGRRSLETKRLGGPRSRSLSPVLGLSVAVYDPIKSPKIVDGGKVDHIQRHIAETLTTPFDPSSIFDPTSHSL